MEERLWGSRSPPPKTQKRKIDMRSPSGPKPMPMMPHTKVVTKALGPPMASSRQDQQAIGDHPMTMPPTTDQNATATQSVQEQKIQDLEKKVEDLTKMMELMMRDAMLTEKMASGWQPRKANRGQRDI